MEAAEACRAVEREAGPDNDPSRPKRKWMRSFVASAAPSVATIGHVARLLVYEAGELIACVGCARPIGSEAYSRADLRALSRLAPEIATSVRESWRLERSSSPSEVGAIMVSRRGEVSHSSSAGRAWLETRAWARSAPVLGRALRTTEEPFGTVLSHGLELRWTRMRGETEQFLVRVSLAPRLRLAPDAVLSPRQRRIAALATQGKSAAEIATLLSCSTGTVRSHLREIYRRLGVSNRAELTLALEDQIDD